MGRWIHNQAHPEPSTLFLGPAKVFSLEEPITDAEMRFLCAQVFKLVIPEFAEGLFPTRA